jgi:hypothetical protein
MSAMLAHPTRACRGGRRYCVPVAVVAAGVGRSVAPPLSRRSRAACTACRALGASSAVSAAWLVSGRGLTGGRGLSDTALTPDPEHDNWLARLPRSGEAGPQTSRPRPLRVLGRRFTTSTASRSGSLACPDQVPLRQLRMTTKRRMMSFTVADSRPARLCGAAGPGLRPAGLAGAVSPRRLPGRPPPRWCASGRSSSPAGRAAPHWRSAIRSRSRHPGRGTGRSRRRGWSGRWPR